MSVQRRWDDADAMGVLTPGERLTSLEARTTRLERMMGRILGGIVVIAFEIPLVVGFAAYVIGR